MVFAWPYANCQTYEGISPAPKDQSGKHAPVVQTILGQQSDSDDESYKHGSATAADTTTSGPRALAGGSQESGFRYVQLARSCFWLTVLFRITFHAFGLKFPFWGLETTQRRVEDGERELTFTS